ncbi:RNase A-like domain-containing protein [Lysinibacillus xylanilyticus]|uniref:RNase A-like domain-containing protein n=1 Tax=Lysinibacillus xylanilyticus TaxID=582475 RepID=UPI003823FADB
MISNNEVMFCKLTDEEIERKLRFSFTDITCFYNRDTAINAINETLMMHSEEIAEWIWQDSSESHRRMRLETTHLFPIGYGISKKGKQKYTDLTKSYLILEKSGLQDEGFHIIFTAPLIEY